MKWSNDVGKWAKAEGWVVVIGVCLAFLLSLEFPSHAQTPTVCGGDTGLQWDLNAESDMAKYYVYAVPDSAPIFIQGEYFAEVIHDLSKAVTMPDGRKVLQEALVFPFPDGVYHFAVSAVDTSNNESGVSNPFICNVQIPPDTPTGFVIIQLVGP